MKRLLMLHNFYRYRGGEDAAVEAEQRLLQEAGWEVELFSVNSGEIQKLPLGPKLARYAQLPYSLTERSRLRRWLEGKQFSAAHLHNLTPFLSASVLGALPEGLPRLQTLHNFRAFCINGLFLRDGKPCEDCPKVSAINGVVHRCHEGSLASSVGLSLAQRSMKAARGSVDLFACPSQFSLDKHAQYGFEALRLKRLPNFVADPGRRSSLEGPGLYLSRFSSEKGAGILAQALLAAPQLPFALAGSGPMEAEMRSALSSHGGLRWLGWLNEEAMLQALEHSGYLVMPSICYDNQPLAVLLALAMGLPLIASKIGGLPELVQEGFNGFLVEPGNAAALAEAMQRMQGLGMDERRRMGEASRALYEGIFTPQRHLAGLEGLIDEAVAMRAA